ncbi:MAG: hypothetical protein KC964_09860 [Candidatus Omnitrophica bacterium]|nr:hypothetical protein [Candidatus Omnitrophota bacterium]
MKAQGKQVRVHRILIPLLFPFLLASCSETIEEEFKDHQEVQEKSYFDRGWIPRNLPESARSIFERYDLDTNDIFGTFEFSPSEAESFTGSMTRVGEGEEIPLLRMLKGDRWGYGFRQGSQRADFEKEGFAIYQHDGFFFAVHEEKGRALFWGDF